MAQRAVAHREEHGPFGSLDDLAAVRGFGPGRIEALRGRVTVRRPETAKRR
jgi:competence protein ComEA